MEHKSMHKESKWAKSIIELQENDGKWGWFHSLSKNYSSPITTERALHRLERLGYTIEDECIQKAVQYMDDCLTGKNTLPDRREKLHDWDVFTSLMLATWIRRFTKENLNANRVAAQWTELMNQAFADGSYHHSMYVNAYQEMFGMKPQGGRLVDFVNFYPVSLLKDCLSGRIEEAFIKYVLQNPNGMYYVYECPLCILPRCFESRESSRYLGALELLSAYETAKESLRFAVEWVKSHKNPNGKWDMGKTVNDKVYFPLSDNWRKKTAREDDCTERVGNLLRLLEG